MSNVSVSFEGLEDGLGDHWAGPVALLRDVPAAVLAVSGGPDSMAMSAGLALLQKAGLITTDLTVATVDHGLRAQAADEVALVRRVAELFALPCVSITLSPPRAQSHMDGNKSDGERTPRGNIQDWARAKRYAFLADVAGDHNAVILTAHTADDQAETLLMRAARGTGTEGLAGIRERTTLFDRTVLRPFLAWPREQLRAVLDDVGIEPAHDPSNRDRAYTRVRFREWLSDAPEPHRGQSLVEGMAQTARLAAQDSDALQVLGAKQFAALGGAVHGYVRGTLHLDDLPRALLARVLRLAMHAVGRGQSIEPVFDLARMSDLAARMQAKRYGKTVLGGACLEWETDTNGLQLLAYAEAGRDGFPCVEIASGEAGHWDNRYWVENPTGQTVWVRSYEKGDAALAGNGVPVPSFVLSKPASMPPPRVMATLPVIVDGQGLPLASAVPGFLEPSTPDGLHVAHIPRTRG